MSFTSFALLFVILLLPPSSSPVEEPYPQVAGEINRWRDPDPDDCPQLMYVDNPYEPIPDRLTTKIAHASFISKCYPGRVDFLRSLPHPFPPFPQCIQLEEHQSSTSYRGSCNQGVRIILHLGRGDMAHSNLCCQEQGGGAKFSAKCSTLFWTHG